MELNPVNIAEYIPMKDQNEINPEQDGDYIQDGLLYCGVCRRPKQYLLKFGGFSRLVPCLCECREQERREEARQREYRDSMAKISRLRESSMMSSAFQGATFSVYRLTGENRRAHRIARNYVAQFERMAGKNQGLIFYGPVGTGKSFTSACIANALLSSSVPVVMTSFVKILQDFQSRTMPEGEYIQTINRARLLILDDLGAERNTDYALEKVYNVIDSRVRAALPMILTTNLTMDEMMNPPDIRYKRIYDRIFGCCYPVEMSGPSLRMERAADNFEQMGGLVDG